MGKRGFQPGSEAAKRQSERMEIEKQIVAMGKELGPTLTEVFTVFKATKDKIEEVGIDKIIEAAPDKKTAKQLRALWERAGAQGLAWALMADPMKKILMNLASISDGIALAKKSLAKLDELEERLARHEAALKKRVETERQKERRLAHDMFRPTVHREHFVEEKDKDDGFAESPEESDARRKEFFGGLEPINR